MSIYQLGFRCSISINVLRPAQIKSLIKVNLRSYPPFLHLIPNKEGTIHLLVGSYVQKPISGFFFFIGRGTILTTGCYIQRAKKVMSDSPGLVDFAIALVDSDHHLPDGQVKFFGN